MRQTVVVEPIPQFELEFGILQRHVSGSPRLRVNNLQCDDCKKSYTKHTWDSSVQASLGELDSVPTEVG